MLFPAVIGVGLLMVPGATLVYEAGGGAACARCHEIAPQHQKWVSSSHRKVPCQACHGDALTMDADFHLGNFRRLVKHLRGDVPEQVKIRPTDVMEIVYRCQKCHRQEFADWENGPHGIKYSKIFVDREHNEKRLLMDDCLRCHGTHFEGGIQDLVTPIDTKGPWTFKSADYADRPAIPCLSCHSMHREGEPMVRAKEGTASTAQEIVRPSLAFLDRRERMHYSITRLPLPVMREGDRPVKMSPDARQALCYQCHAPLSTFQAGSGDDRTGLGVHEGLSCLACHQKHGQKTRASCANCHPRLSNCGLDVEKMDTTFFHPKSTHNVHFVKCVDCHTKGIPKKKAPTEAQARLRAD
jgi:hypothetical protein